MNKKNRNIKKIEIKSKNECGSVVSGFVNEWFFKEF
jgi:hypothetical protein